jgi:hypothetical protein
MKAGARIVEVEVMSELQKLFGIPMKNGNAIYRKI